MNQKLVEQIADMPNKERKSIKGGDEMFIPSGSTLLNLALSGRMDGGWKCGNVANIIGDSGAGKSLLALTTLAEAGCHEAFDNHRCIYDDVERANGFDMAGLFGKNFEDRVEAPAYDDGVPVFSSTIEDMEMHIDDAINYGEPFIYIEDSLDALTNFAELDKSKENLEKRRKNQQEKGTYGMNTPKELSRILRQIKDKLKNTQSTVIIISQVRDNIDPRSFSKQTRSGGRALKFYSIHEMWLALTGKLSSKVGNLTVPYGVTTKTKISKNKITGKVREVEFPIYYDYGIDDITSCIEFLEKTKHWGKSGNKIKAEELDLVYTKRKLVEEIERNNLENDLREITTSVWNEIEEKVSVGSGRKSKYE